MTEDTIRAAGVRVDHDGPITRVTLDRPDVRNAQTPAMWRALAEVGAGLPDRVRVVVLQATGRSFSAGLDRAVLDGSADESVVDLMALDDAGLADRIDDYQRGFTWLRDPRFVSIAAVQGHAVGAGFQLALSCDLRVVADDASFCMKESALGLVPDLTGTKPLVESVGYARALEICATARFVGAAEAVQIGLALTAVPATDLQATVDDLAAALLAPMPGVVSETKQLLHGAHERPLEEQRRLERTAQVRRFRAMAAAMTAR